MYKHRLLAVMMGVALSLTPVVAQAEENSVVDDPQLAIVEQTELEQAAPEQAEPEQADSEQAEPADESTAPADTPVASETVPAAESSSEDEVPAENPVTPDDDTASITDAPAESEELPSADSVEAADDADAPDVTTDEPRAAAAAETEVPASDAAPAEGEAQLGLAMQGTTPLKDGSVYSLAPSHATNQRVGATGNTVALAKTWLLSDFWKAILDSDGSYRLQNLDSGKYLAVSGTPTVGAAVVLAKKATNWLVSLNSDGALSFAPQGYANLRLNVKGSGKTAGTSLELAKKGSGASQQFIAKKSSTLTSAATHGMTIDEGAYIISPATNTKLAIDIAKTSTENKGNALVWTKSGKLVQDYGFTYVGNGLYTIQAGHSGKLLEVAGGSSANGANVQQYSRAGMLQQYWYVVKEASGYSIRNARSGKALALAGDAATKGANVQQAAATTDPARLFQLKPTSFVTNGTVYQFAPQCAGSLPLAAKGNGASSGTAVVTTKKSAHLGEYWKAVVGADGSVTFVNLRSNRKLGLSAAAAKSVGAVVSNTATDWLITVNDDATFSIRLKDNPSLTLDIKGGSSKEGAAAQLYTANGSKAQKFTFSAQSYLTDASKKGVVLGDGFYRIVPAASTKLAVEVKDGSKDNKANVQLGSLSSSSFAQKYELVPAGNGLYVLKAANSSKVVEVAGGSTSAKANVRQYARNESLSQFWYLIKDGAGYSIRNAKSGLALEVSPSLAKGSNVQVNKAKSSDVQRFKIEETQLVNDGTYAFASDLTYYKMLVLEVKGGSTSDGANVQAYQSNGTKAQKWKVKYLGSGVYSLTNVKSGLLLEVAGKSKSNGGNVQQGASDGSAFQQWYIGVSNYGGLTFKNVGSGKCLDIAGGKSGNGVNVHQWSNNNASKARSFTLKTNAEHDSEKPPAGKLGTFVKRMVYYADIVNVGYDMGNRWDVRDGGETDCSALVITCLKEAGLISAADAGSAVTYTGNMSSYLTQRGWKRFNIYSSSGLLQLMPGDILLNDELHTCAVIAGKGSAARVAQASIDENGHGWNGQSGDQTGYETNIKQAYWYSSGWDCILRYVG